MRIEQDDALVHIVERSVKDLEFVGMLHDVGDVGVTQHAPAVRQRGALEAQYFAAAQAQIARLRLANLHMLHALGDIGVQQMLGHVVGAGVATVIHQRDKGGIGVCLGVRQSPHFAEGAVDEPRA